MPPDLRYWPDDADGDALREVESLGVDLGAVQAIDFNIDFDLWPPQPALIDELRNRYDEVRIVEPSDDNDGYVVVVIEDRLSYELVVATQETLSELAEPFEGRCESWSVLH
jgi:hypothetical protein